MPLTMGDIKTDDYFIAADDDLGLVGSALGPGQKCNVTSGDPLTVVITEDTTVRDYTDPAGKVTKCVASGKIASAKPPAAPSTPITLTAHVSEADGTPGKDDTGVPIVDATDTVTIQPGLAKHVGFLFGVAA